MKSEWQKPNTTCVLRVSSTQPTRRTTLQPYWINKFRLRSHKALRALYGDKALPHLKLWHCSVIAEILSGADEKTLEHLMAHGQQATHCTGAAAGGPDNPAVALTVQHTINASYGSRRSNNFWAASS